MNRPDLYKRTVGILVDAYFNDTLENQNSCGCAVGNIIAANNSIEIVIGDDGRLDWKENNPCWYNKLRMFRGTLTPSGEHTGGLQIESTGYTIEEIDIIEKAFEGRMPRGTKFPDEEMFNALMRVIDALDIIHENKDEVVTTTSKERFVKDLLSN